MAIQHPLPQDISSYRFRLIGDMTLKQFASLGACVILALIFYGLPLPFFFKYPLVFTLVLLGIGMAFVPVQGRSLDVWLVAFIKSIYSPTQYTWKQSPSEINSSSPTPTTPPLAPQTPPVPTPTIPPQTDVKTAPSPSPVITPPPITPPSTSSSPIPTINLPIPFTPTTPNTLVGLTLTKQNTILDGVMIEIKKDNLTLRATKSNKLGQFMFARPLDHGTYQILAEKEGCVFAPYSLQLTGEIVKPLKIQAQ